MMQMRLLLNGGVQIITTTDFTEKLHRLNEETDLPVTSIHGDKDSGCPASASVDFVRKTAPRTVVKIYENGAHGELKIGI